MVKVRTTMRPWEEVEVDPREAASLKNMNLLLDNDTAPGFKVVDAKKQHERGRPDRSSTDKHEGK